MPETRAEDYIVRIMDKDHVPVGTGCLISSRYILTCAHVVQKLDKGIEFSFLRFPQKKYMAYKTDQILPDEGTSFGNSNDIAVLELSQDAASQIGVSSGPEFDLSDPRNSSVRVCGFPKGLDKGDWAYGKIIGSIAEGLEQFDNAAESKCVAPGYSGAPVWDEHTDAFVGMVVSTGKRKEMTSAYMISTSTLAKVCPGLDLKKREPIVTEQRVEPSGKLPKLGPYHKYTCDRTKQHDQFTKNREKRQGGKVHFFCLHGWDGQSPKGLARRFNFELKKKITGSLRSHHTNEYNDDVHDINVVDSREKEIFKYKLIYGLFSFYKVETDKFAPITKSNLGVVCNNSPILKGSSGIKTVYIRIDTYDWREFVPDVLEWFVNTFCSEGFLPEGAPEFYFFISLIYEKEDCVDSRKQIIPAIKDKVKGIHVFDEFDEVTKKDIKRWLNKHITDIPDKKRREIFSNYFDDEDEYDMDEVEQNLEEIIGIINENK